MKKTLAVGLALLASLTAFCVSAQAVERGETPFKVHYRCADQRALSVVYPAYADAEHEPIRLTWRGKDYRLRPTEAGSGARYANQQLVWWTKGETGFLATRGGRSLVRDCHEVSSKPVE
ncbi:MliC family protein [Crenobacter sp. SG2305]|uniref:MliC family protein n=1 Tax=Crenobacter oryzisoli TaxID=3056844 RepID=UPI0025AAA01A|nr:MliC family protein [Crenobacter sp. SG2305]MDN0084122.1 MliC family protein [Crenobacter sp. SG2305]